MIECNLKIKAKLYTYNLHIDIKMTLKVQEVVQSTWSCKIWDELFSHVTAPTTSDSIFSNRTQGE